MSASLHNKCQIGFADFPKWKQNFKLHYCSQKKQNKIQLCFTETNNSSVLFIQLFIVWERRESVFVCMKLGYKMIKKNQLTFDSHLKKTDFNKSFKFRGKSVFIMGKQFEFSLLQKNCCGNVSISNGKKTIWIFFCW